MDMTSVFAEITKTAPQDDGSLMVYGKATGGDLDLDQQRCDPAWLSRAMPEWFAIGNVRSQHNPKEAVGKAVEHEVKDDGHWIKANIVDPVAVAKTKAGVFTGFSIGIAGPRVSKSADAPGGVISDGKIVEVSLVDRPALPTAMFTMCKAAKPGMKLKASDFDSDRMLVKCEELTVTEDVEKSADVETTLSADPDETKSAEQAEVEEVDETKTAEPAEEVEPDADLAKALVAAVAGKEGLDAAKAAGEVLNKANGDVPPQYDDEQSDVLNAQAAISIIGKLIVSEASELVDNPAEACDIQILLQAVSALRCFIGREQQQSLGENDVNNGPDVVLLAAEADVEKAKYSAEEMRQMLKDGKAFKNANGEPSYPIGDKDDLSNAIKAVGRGSGDHDAIRAYIQRRAKALGASDMIPDGWSSSGSNKAAEATPVVDEYVEKTVTVTEVNKGAGDFLRYLIDALSQIADEGEPALDKNFEPDLVKGFDVKTVAYGVAFLFKAIASGIEKSDTTLNKSVKAVVETATESTAKSVSSLMERLEKVESMAVPGGPALRRNGSELKKSRQQDLLDLARVEEMKAAEPGIDADLRRGYQTKAARMRAEARTLSAVATN